MALYYNLRGNVLVAVPLVGTELCFVASPPLKWHSNRCPWRQLPFTCPPLPPEVVLSTSCRVTCDVEARSCEASGARSASPPPPHPLVVVVAVARVVRRLRLSPCDASGARSASPPPPRPLVVVVVVARVVRRLRLSPCDASGARSANPPPPRPLVVVVVVARVVRRLRLSPSLLRRCDPSRCMDPSLGDPGFSWSSRWPGV